MAAGGVESGSASLVVESHSGYQSHSGEAHCRSVWVGQVLYGAEKGWRSLELFNGSQ